MSAYNDNDKAEISYFVAGCAGLFFGGIVGLFGGLVLPCIYYQLTNPAFFRDGLGFMVFFLTLPAGGGIGALAGCGVSCYVAAQERAGR